jgi:hypothetical protein
MDYDQSVASQMGAAIMKAATRLLAMVLLGLAAVPTAWADHRYHGPRVGIVIGPYVGPYFGPGWPYRYPPYYYGYGAYPYYYPPVVVERVAPPVYIEQQQAEPPATGTVPPPINYWYYCPPTQAYYPYVKECPTGWRKVLPTPPGQQ